MTLNEKSVKDINNNNKNVFLFPVKLFCGSVDNYKCLAYSSLF